MSTTPSSRNVKYLQSAVLVLVLVVLLVVLGVVTYRYRVLPRDARLDSYPSWVGTRLVLAGQNPYLYEYDYQRFHYPATLSIILLPVFLLPAPLAVTVWSVLQIVFAVGSMLLLLKMLELRLNPLGTAGLLCAGLIVWRYPMVTYASSNFVNFALFCLTASAWLSKRERDWWAGVVVSLAALRGEGVIMVVLFVLYHAWERRWIVVAGAAVSILTLLSITFALIGFWIPDFLRNAARYAEEIRPTWPPSFVSPASRVLLAMFMPLASFSVLRYVGRSTLIVLSLIVINTLTFAIVTSPYALSALLIPLLTMLAYFKSRYSFILWIVLVTLPWTRPYLVPRMPGYADLLLMPFLTLMVFALDHWLHSATELLQARLSRPG